MKEGSIAGLDAAILARSSGSRIDTFVTSTFDGTGMKEVML